MLGFLPLDCSETDHRTPNELSELRPAHYILIVGARPHAEAIFTSRSLRVGNEYAVPGGAWRFVLKPLDSIPIGVDQGGHAKSLAIAA
jgi:hypothetical protein